MPDETVIGTYASVRDGVVFTDKRVISVNVQGFTGKKKDFTSMPYSKVTVFPIETSGPYFFLETYSTPAGTIVMWFVIIYIEMYTVCFDGCDEKYYACRISGGF